VNVTSAEHNCVHTNKYQPQRVQNKNGKGTKTRIGRTKDYVARVSGEYEIHAVKHNNTDFVERKRRRDRQRFKTSKTKKTVCRQSRARLLTERREIDTRVVRRRSTWSGCVFGICGALDGVRTVRLFGSRPVSNDWRRDLFARRSGRRTSRDSRRWWRTRCNKKLPVRISRSRYRTTFVSSGLSSVVACIILTLYRLRETGFVF